MAFLIKMWNEVVAKIAGARCPSLIYSDLDLLLRTVRDLFTADVEKLIIDSRSEYDRIKKFIAAFMPDFNGQIELFPGSEPIFDGYGYPYMNMMIPADLVSHPERIYRRMLT